MKPSLTSFPHFGQNGIYLPPVPLIHHTRIKDNGQYRKFLNSNDTLPIRPITNQVLCPQNNREKLFRSQGGGEGGTALKLLFEKKGLIPALQQLLVSYQKALE